jgi:hypothetical protein
MRLCIIPDIVYEDFEAIVDTIVNSKLVYGMFSTMYRKNLRKGLIWFWGAEWIPEYLKTKYMTTLVDENALRDVSAEIGRYFNEKSK